MRRPEQPIGLSEVATHAPEPGAAHYGRDRDEAVAVTVVAGTVVLLLLVMASNAVALLAAAWW